MEIALATFLRGVGFTFTQILEMIILVGMNFVFILLLVWRFRAPITEFFKTMNAAMDSIPKMQESISSLNKTLQEHIIQTDLRMEMGDERFVKLEQRIAELEKTKE